METFEAFVNKIPFFITVLTGIMTGATFITMLTPSKHDDKIVSAILKVLNVLAGNIAKNKNLDDK